MKNYSIYREPKVFITYNSITTTCSIDENKSFFKDNLNLDIYNFYKNEISYDCLISKLPNNKFEFIKNKITSILALSLFISSNPNQVFSLSSLESFKSNGFMVLSVLGETIIQSMLIITALKIAYAYLNGYSQQKIFDILKECVAVILIIVLLPQIPTIFSYFKK